MKIIWLILFFIPSAFAEYNCKGLDTTLNEQIQKLNKSCNRKSDCQLDVLDWTACGKPIAHNDKDLAKQIVEARNQLHQMCKYVIAPCPAITSEVHCVSSRCETQEDLVSRNLRIELNFVLNNQILKNAEIIIEADNGIRCEQVPCPSMTRIGTYQIGTDGKVILNLNDLMKKKSDSGLLQPKLSSFSWDEMRIRFQNKVYQLNLNLYLATNQAPFLIHINWKD